MIAEIVITLQKKKKHKLHSLNIPLVNHWVFVALVLLWENEVNAHLMLALYNPKKDKEIKEKTQKILYKSTFA